MTEFLPYGVRAAPANAWRFDAATAAITFAAVFLALIAPAVWNGYPLLQFDTGGYIARWYEGYLVPSRSTVYGYFLLAGERSGFWLNVLAQALATVFVLNLTLRVNGIARCTPRLAIVLAVCATTALPWLASMLLTDIFAGLGVLAIYLLAAHRQSASRTERAALVAVVAVATASHSATFAILTGLACCGWIVLPFLKSRLSCAGLATASAAIVLGVLLLLASNHALSGRVAWTPGGYGIAFGRMLEDGIVKRYLDDHCGRVQHRLCPHRAHLPPTADEFLWSNSIFNRLGRFNGLGEEMRTIVLESLAQYPAAQAAAAARATVRQLAMVASGYGVHNQLWHTYGIMERFIPSQIAPMRAARQQNGGIDFTLLNRIHVPAAYLSIAALLVILAAAGLRRNLEGHALPAAVVTVTILGNAMVCGALSGPHDRYGSRIVWLATFVAAMAVAERPRKMQAPTTSQGRRDRNASTPAL
jgi:hypothetical protein